MTYNLSSIQTVFATLYTALRREFSDYLQNYGGRSYFVFANVVIKRPGSINFYSSFDQAATRGSVSGVLPSLSEYYFRERPLFIRNWAEFFDKYFSQKTSITNFNPVIKLTIFYNGRYVDAYIPFDSAVMEMKWFISDAMALQVYAEQIATLNKVVVANLQKLAVVYNQLVQYKNAKAAGKVVDNNYLSTMDNYVSQALQAYRSDYRYVTKYCKECASSVQVGSNTLNLDFIVTGGALSLEWITSKNFIGEYGTYLSLEKDSNSSRELVLERYLYGFDQRWKQIANPSYKPIEVDVKPLPQVTVTATANKKSWVPWLLLVGIGAVALSGGNTKKEK